MIRNRKDTKLIFIHCSATTAKQDIGAHEIHKWHLERGIYSERGLTGYHYIIRRSGLIELGRDLQAIGAHAHGFNDFSVGICLVGGVKKEGGQLVAENNFTQDQFDSLADLVRKLKRIYETAALVPHNAVAAKDCPSFDVWKWQQARFGQSDEEAARKAIKEIKGED